MGGELKIFRCRFRAGGRTTTVECVAPTAEDAAYVVGTQALQDGNDTWVQVVVSQWLAVLGQYVDPANATMVTRGDPPPPGAGHVVLQARTSTRLEVERD